MPRKRKELAPGETLHLSMRLDADVAARVDALVTELAEATGLTVTRTDVVRLLLKEALNARDARMKRKK